LDLSQQPSLVSKLPVSLIDLLQQALASHRYALRLNQDNPDVLFNTAQVLTSLAEEIIENPTVVPQHDPAGLLSEALELLNACYSRQEILIEEQKKPQTENDDEDAQEGVSLNDSSSTGEDATPPEVEQSVTIQHPTTAADMLDTACASLSALTLLIPLSNGSHVSDLSTLANNLVANTIPQCLSQIPEDQRTEAAAEAATASVSFIAAVSNAEFLTNSISLSTYASRLETFEALNIQTDHVVICIYADSLVELATAVIRKQTSGDNSTLLPDGEGPAAWQVLTKAQSLYGVACKLPNNPDFAARRATTLESRGDVEMLRFRLTAPEWQLSASLQGKAKDLINNAAVYYRGAAQQFHSRDEQAAANKARVRETIAKIIACGVLGTSEQVRSEYFAELGRHGQLSEAVGRDMIAESLINNFG